LIYFCLAGFLKGVFHLPKCVVMVSWSAADKDYSETGLLFQDLSSNSGGGAVRTVQALLD